MCYRNRSSRYSTRDARAALNVPARCADGLGRKQDRDGRVRIGDEGGERGVEAVSR
jgi:hypothetical protein